MLMDVMNAARELGIGQGTLRRWKREGAMTDEKKANDLAAAGGNGDLDLARLRLGQDFADKVGVKKALLTVPVRKPDRQSFVRVHPDPSWRLDTAVITLKDERETYL